MDSDFFDEQDFLVWTGELFVNYYYTFFRFKLHKILDQQWLFPSF